MYGIAVFVKRFKVIKSTTANIAFKRLLCPEQYFRGDNALKAGRASDSAEVVLRDGGSNR